MKTARVMMRLSVFLVLSSVLLMAGCSSHSSHDKDPESLSVTLTSPSWNVTIPQGQSVEFVAGVTGGVSPYVYDWDFGGGANNTSEEDPGQVVFDTPGSYTVRLTVTDSSDASVSASVVVTVQEKEADTPPGMRYTIPTPGAIDVGLYATVQVVFTAGVDLSTVNSSTFLLRIGGTEVPGTITASDQLVTFTPAAGLQYGTLYTATLTTGIQDTFGKQVFPSDYSWTFSTIGYTLSASIASPAEDVTIKEGQSVTFQGSAEGGNPPYAYKWSFGGDIPPSELENPGIVRFATRGTYSVVLRVYDASGHVSYALRTVTVYSSTEGDWTHISAGNGHTVALKSDGTLWAWGSNAYGQIGDGTVVNRYVPVKISSGWSSVCAGAEYTLGIKSDGTLWAWGRNNNGQLGDGTDTDRRTPVQIGTETTWTKIAAGSGHSLALKTDGTLWAWGLNSSGQLGDSTFVDKNSPVQVGHDTNWTVMAAGHAHNLAIKTDGSLWSWGLNDEGQLGDGTTVTSNVPGMVGSENSWTAVAAGNEHSVALRNDGILKAWGDNNYGQLGTDSTHDSTIPVLVDSSKDWASIAATYEHTMAVKDDGTLWVWGLNNKGQLGDGTNENEETPYWLESSAAWEAITTGFYHSGAIRKGGTLWMWGDNTYGQLGDGTTTSRLTPVQVKQ